ncbi:hypothetical protein F2Q65_17570 [Thiohalocapsa marina]|uniref:Uncharacterized protein n=1 Tax=Thiohalocapsa marina TaxID=424902 RepID=A0A5M8FCJ1_9GAMM|nr:hypothetical protein [Thiohalocapsa marina]KAA6182588.1 hypothetical protein F2Q65_17570 [Thiohalocapsa marina]
MGSSVIATCSACGYQSEPLMIGGGMADFHALCAFPAYCAKGNHLLTINLFDDPCRCRTHRAVALPYNDPALVGEAGRNIVVSWNFDNRTAILTDGRYFCPACHQNTLSFADYGLMWD